MKRLLFMKTTLHTTTTIVLRPLLMVMLGQLLRRWYHTIMHIVDNSTQLATTVWYALYTHQIFVRIVPDGAHGAVIFVLRSLNPFLLLLFAHAVPQLTHFRRCFPSMVPREHLPTWVFPKNNFLSARSLLLPCRPPTCLPTHPSSDLCQDMLRCCRRVIWHSATVRSLSDPQVLCCLIKRTKKDDGDQDVQSYGLLQPSHLSCGMCDVCGTASKSCDVCGTASAKPTVGLKACPPHT